jgi:hypothetical protein
VHACRKHTFQRGFEYIPFAASNDAYGPIETVFG